MFQRLNYTGLLGIAILFLLVIMILFGPFFSGYTYSQTHLSLKNQPPSSAFWFGTDDLGRDIFTRVCYGARISLFVGLIAAFIDLCIGVLWGGFAGFIGGFFDELLMRIADILYSIPYLLVVILLTMMLGSGLLAIILSITFTGWITMARIVRGQILLIKEMEYVYVAKMMGSRFRHILFRHLIPNAISPILVTLMFTIPSAIFAEAFLSFLGIGIQAPIASWGTMANEGLPAMPYYPWRLFFPAFFISITLLAFYLIGENMKKSLLQPSQ